MENRFFRLDRRAGLWLAVLLIHAFCLRIPVYALSEEPREEQDFAAAEAPRSSASFTFYAEDETVPGLSPSEENASEPSAQPAETAVPAAEEDKAACLAEQERLLRDRLSSDKDAYHIMVNREQNTVTVYEQDESGAYTVPVCAMVCSTGSKTPLGTFETSRKYEWRPLFGGVFGQYATRITGNILFHSVPYKETSRDSLKYEEYNKLGTSASMGCIRLAVEDAKWLYDYCAGGTLVTIYEDEDPGPLGKPEPINIAADSPNRGWDPTDPDPSNPWRIGENTRGETAEGWKHP